MSVPDPQHEAAAHGDLVRRVESLEHRLALLERRLSATAVAEPDGEADGLVLSAAASAEVMPLVGRTLVVLGGAFVLRALTETGLLAPRVGALAGIAYAMFWFVLAARVASRGRRSSAIAHGAAGSVIAFPLILEATIQFGLFAPPAAVATLAVVTATGLGVAWQARLRALASLVALGAVATLLVLAVASKVLVLATACLLVGALALPVVVWTRGWTELSWAVWTPSALAVALLPAIVLMGDPARTATVLRPDQAVALQLALVVVSVGPLVARAVAAGRGTSPGEMMQGVVATAIGLGGALTVSRATGTGALAIGSVAAALAAIGYGASFSSIDRALGRANFIFHSTLALVFALVAAQALLPPGALAVVLAGAAVLMACAGARTGRATLSGHGAIYAVAAASWSGLLGGATRALIADPGTPWVSVPAVVALLASGIACAFPVPAHGRTWGRLSGLPKVATLLVVAVGSAGLASTTGTRLLDGLGVAPAARSAAIAVLRTGVLAAGAVALARCARSPRLREAAWLVYPVLVAGGLKLVAEDLRAGRPAALVLSLTLYGLALILAPRMARQRR